MSLLGIDPGLHGALCYMGRDGVILDLMDMPVLQVKPKSKKVSLDYHGLAALVKEWRPDHAFVEQVWAMPAHRRPGPTGEIRAEGFTSVMVGVYMAVLATLTTAGIPWTPVAPRTWQASLKVPGGKDGSRARASQLMPADAGRWTRVKDDGRAESALIALHGLRQIDSNS